jgi:hypothetical protein
VSELELVVSLVGLAMAGLAQGVFGLGFAMIATPVLALFLDHRAAVFLAAVPLLAVSGLWLVVNRRRLRYAGLPWPLLPGIVAGAAVGVGVQVVLSQRSSLLLLAALLALSIAMPWGLQRLRVDVSLAARRYAPFFGLLAGVTEAALNVGAPFMLLFGELARLTRHQQLIALNLGFFLGKTVQVSLLSASAWPVSPMNLALGVITSLLFYRIGDRLAGRCSEAAFRRLLPRFIGVMALSLIARAVTSAP